LAASACGSDGGGDGQACTLIGCVDQVTNRPTWQGSPVVKVQGTVVADGVTIAINCLNGGGGAGYMCSPDGVAITGAPAKLVITLASGDVDVVGLEVSPSYVTSQPNGKGCDPICKQATVTVELGGGLTDVIGSGDGTGGADADATGGDDSVASDGVASDSAEADTAGVDAAGGDTAGGDTAEQDTAEQDTTEQDTAEQDTAEQDAAEQDTSKPDDGGTACCKGPEDCVGGHCISGVCYDTTKLPSGQCWLDQDCPTDEVCGGASTCPCGALCFVADKPGTCSKKPSGGACCDANTPCGIGMFCAKTTCKVLKELGANECWADAQCLQGEVCEGAMVCSCAAQCPAADKPGVCKSAPSSCTTIDPGGYGTCEMVMGLGYDGKACVTVSGCGCKDNCAGIYKTLDECQAACMPK